MRYSIFSYLLLILTSQMFAQNIISIDDLNKICGTPEIRQVDAEKYLEKIKSTRPDEFKRIMDEIQFVREYNSLYQQQKLFWSYNFRTEQYYTVPATLRKSGTISRIWVEDASWSKNYVTQAIVDEILNNLELNTPATSIDPSNGIIKIDTMLFGQPPNYDGDGIVDFLILDIQDNFDSTSTGSSFIAGYFSPTDQTNLSYSNKMDLMYLDSYPGIYYQGNYRTDRVMSTTAHEFQHLIHYNYDRDESDWINEGLSELAGTYCGYGLDFPSLYLDSTNVSLIGWSGKVKDYARVNLWTVYCAEQLGLLFIKELVQNTDNGISSFNQTMVLSGNSGSFNDVFKNWTLANWLNDTNINPLFGYSLAEAQGLRAQINKLVYEFNNTNISGNIKNYGVEYHRFRGKDSLDILLTQPAEWIYWIIKSGDNYSISPIQTSSILDPLFSDENENILILSSDGSAANYSYRANAKYSLRYYDLGYDDNQVDVSISFSTPPGIAANRFYVPESNLKLESVKFYNSTSNNQVRIHIYNANNSGLPGSDLLAPVDTLIPSGSSWQEIVFTNPLENLPAGNLIFAGIEVTQSGRAIGYDSQNKPGYSYLNLGSTWQPLSEYSINNQPANGVWMIRAIFTGFVSSDSIESGSGLIVENNYPNPFVTGRQNTTIGYSAPEEGEITVFIYNSLGQRVARLSTTNTSQIIWNGMGDNGSLAAGVYFYQIHFRSNRTGKTIKSKFSKMILW